MITNCDHREQLKFAKTLPFACFPILFEALSLRLRLAAAPCGKPMAFRSPSPHSFLRLSLRKRTLKATSERLSLSALCGGRAACIANNDPPLPVDGSRFPVPGF